MKKKRVVIPENMGRGIKANTVKAQYEVDLTDYVDGSTVTYTGGKLGVNVPASITSVSTTGAIEGDGSSTNPVKLEFNDSIVKGTDGKYGVAETGLTCASIDDLPEKLWKKGTTIIAKQDGACVRLAALDSIFQEIGVGITADKTNSFTNEEYNVVVTVSNTGESTNELTNLNIVGPEITPNYTVKNVRVGNSGADEVERVDNFTYNIRGLRKGGTVNVKFTVVPNTLGTYQFTAAVNPNSALDKDLGNNSATITLSARTKADPTYIPSVDCPLITATELDHNTVLQQLEYNIGIGQSRSRVASTAATDRANIFVQRRTLKGLRIRLENASTVVGYTGNQNSGAPTGVAFDGISAPSSILLADKDNYILSEADDIKRGVGGYTFSNGILEITEDILHFSFSCRPQGNNCKWQSYTLVATIPNVRKNITVSNVVGATTSKNLAYKYGVSHNRSIPVPSIAIPSSEQSKLKPLIDLFGVYIGSPAEEFEKLIVNVKAGTAASLTYNSTDNYATKSIIQGKTTITANTIIVSADAKATDSVNTPYIQVIIEE